MAQTADLLKNLGKLGLLERLDEETRNGGVIDSKILLEGVRTKKYERVFGIGDDFIPDTSLYNAVGAIYPLLDREQRDDAVWAHLNQFDLLNYMYVQNNHTPYIREPLLLADLAIARGAMYWPGLCDQENLWKGKNFSEFQKETMNDDGLFKLDKVNSDFLVAYGLLRSDFTSFGEDYVRAANPDFLNRVMKGIVAIRFGDGTSEEIEKRRKRLYKLLPKSVHDRVEPLRKEADWTFREQYKH